jgi:predicted nucleic acid-binding protein
MDRIRIFLDTSALFAGIWSANGRARLILNLGEAGALQIVVSRQVLHELDNVLYRKAPASLPILARLLDRTQVKITPPGSEADYEQCLADTRHPGDARILADAWGAGVEYLVNLNQKHILNNPAVRSHLPFQIGTPGDFLQLYRDKFIK